MHMNFAWLYVQRMTLQCPFDFKTMLSFCGKLKFWRGYCVPLCLSTTMILNFLIISSFSLSFWVDWYWTFCASLMFRIGSGKNSLVRTSSAWTVTGLSVGLVTGNNICSSQELFLKVTTNGVNAVPFTSLFHSTIMLVDLNVALIQIATGRLNICFGCVLFSNFCQIMMIYLQDSHIHILWSMRMAISFFVSTDYHFPAYIHPYFI